MSMPTRGQLLVVGFAAGLRGVATLAACADVRLALPPGDTTAKAALERYFKFGSEGREGSLVCRGGARIATSAR
jgi:hypothetical protein